MCLSVCVSECISCVIVAWEAKRRTSKPLELELQAVVSCLLWVLGIQVLCNNSKHSLHPPIKIFFMVLYFSSIWQAHTHSFYLLSILLISKSQLANPKPDCQTVRYSTLPAKGTLAHNIRGRAFKWKTS